MQALSKEDRVAQRAEKDAACSFLFSSTRKTVAEPTRKPSLHNSGLLQAVEQECHEWMKHAIVKSDPAVFNDDVHYRLVVAKAVELKRLALNKVQVLSLIHI